MQSWPSTHLPEEDGTPCAHPRQGRTLFCPACGSAMPQAERDHPLPGVRRPLPVEATREARATILSVGDDRHLLSTRQLVLESAGYEVHSVSAIQALGEKVISRIDLAILCHSVQGEEAAAVISSLRKGSPSMPILRLTTAFVCQHSIGEGVAVLWAPDGPQKLLAQIHSMLAGFRDAATGKPGTGKLP